MRREFLSLCTGDLQQAAQKRCQTTFFAVQRRVDATSRIGEKEYSTAPSRTTRGKRALVCVHELRLQSDSSIAKPPKCFRKSGSSSSIVDRSYHVVVYRKEKGILVPCPLECLSPILSEAAARLRACGKAGDRRNCPLYGDVSPIVGWRLGTVSSVSDFYQRRRPDCEPVAKPGTDGTVHCTDRCLADSRMVVRDSFVCPRFWHRARGASS